MKRTITYLLISLIVGVGAILTINYTVRSTTKERIYTSIKEIPAKRAALLLGTTKYIATGQQNYFYIYRIRAAVRLWKSGKIKAIVVSGDNGTKYYDETTTMYDDLIKAGIPARYITRDYAGFRTLDSVVRAKAIFGLEDYIIISQRFHLERALFIAKAKGQKVIGYVAKDIPGTDAALKMKFREYLARTKAFLDLYVLGTDPKFYGKKEKVTYRH
jgi:SanA protein